MYRRVYRNGRGLGRLLLVLVLLIPLSATFQPAGARAAGELPYRMQPGMTSSNGVDQHGLVADGSFIVWQDSRSGSPDIYAYDLDDSREFRVEQTGGYRSEPAISGSTVVWVSGANPTKRTIDGIDLNTNVSFSVTTQPGAVSQPAIDGQMVVWREVRNGQALLAGKNLANGQTFEIAGSAVNVAHPSISGSTLVWQAYAAGNWDIVSRQIGSSQSTALTSTPDDEIDPVVSGGRVLFLRQPANGGAPKLILMDLANQVERVVVSDHLVMSATLKDGIVVWEDWRTGLPDIYAYDLAHDQTFAVARSQQAHDPAVSSRTIAWVSSSDLTNGRIQSVSLIQRLPTDPQEAPAVPSANSIYVPQTQHFLSAGFKSFWQANGGPQIFGYPLTEEFSERDPATGKERTVQYFERVEMIYDPSAPAGKRVSLARLGSELTAGQDFAKVSAFPKSADRTYFPQTGHSLANGFKQFWEENGGVAIFGYPISEEFSEGGRTVQYFERARLEFNPDAKAGSRVTLGLLGQEALQRKGWLPTPSPPTSTIGPVP